MASVSEITRSEGMRVGAAQKASVVRSGAKYRSEQGSDYEPGVSAETVGSKVLFLGIVTLPASARTKAHVHERHETALYLLNGELEVWTGDQLQHRELVGPGDYIYIPANVLHVAVNRGEKPAVCIGTRNEPTAQESVVLYPEMDARVP
ncbi:cupin domain-containing protein [Bradyrhizobium sp. CCBAU 51627]|uniref:cupin domain-containing protein n=1 Tax=Bradyrhizobium sp. CCBAU 51627 TaxID=1325088 RepID=UPI002304F8F6|nr:cupin domain-containing protein [Bradyrhizobium sp. CCBAU 51627]MDA9433388.1 cupin [Bradyrhizobium sp. CCBAU 51627]